MLSNYKKVILGDREFCAVDLARWLRVQYQTYFCLRLRKNEYIELAPEIWSQLKNLGLKPGLSISLSGVKLTKSKGFNGANIAAKHHRISQIICRTNGSINVFKPSQTTILSARSKS